MGSTGKTDYLRLNRWVSNDIPKMADFNADNDIIDAAFSEHVYDTEKHVSFDERERWNLPYYIGFYYGDGALNRTITTDCPFDPSFGIVFAGNMPLSVTDFNNEVEYHYCGFLTKRFGTSGITLSGRNIVFKTNGMPVLGDEYVNLNNSNLTYCYVFFR